MRSSPPAERRAPEYIIRVSEFRVHVARIHSETRQRHSVGNPSARGAHLSGLKVSLMIVEQLDRRPHESSSVSIESEYSSMNKTHTHTHTGTHTVHSYICMYEYVQRVVQTFPTKEPNGFRLTHRNQMYVYGVYIRCTYKLYFVYVVLKV